MTQTPTDDCARRVLQQLSRRRTAQLAEDLALIEEQFPNVVRDAQRFVRDTHYLPWEAAVAFRDDDVGQLRETYAVPVSRQRPDLDTVFPLTAVFCIACELIFTQLFLNDQQR